MAEPALLDPSPFDLCRYLVHIFDPDTPSRSAASRLVNSSKTTAAMA